MDLLKSLQTLGLTEKESAVYAALLNVKKGTAQTISEAAGIKRPTTYLILESLLQKKIIAVTKFRNVKDYRALPIAHLKSYILNQKKLASKILPSMQLTYNARKQKNRLRVYNGLNDVKTLLEKSLRKRARMHIVGSIKNFQNNLGLYWDFYLKRSDQLGMRPTFKNYEGSAQLLVWEDKIAFVAFGDKPHAVAFKNEKLYALFQNLWTNY